MHQYVIGLVFKRITRNIKAYIFMMLEILLCVFLLNSSMILHHSIKKEYENMQLKVENTYYNFMITNIRDKNDVGKPPKMKYESPPFTLSDLEYIQNTFPEIRSTLHVFDDFTRCIYASKEFFSQHLHVDNPKQWDNVCFVGTEVSGFYIEGMEMYPMASVIKEKTVEVPALGGPYEVDLKKTVILPIRYYFDQVQFDDTHAYNSILSIDFGKEGYSAEVVAKTLMQINSEHPEYTYHYSNSLEQYTRQVDELEKLCAATVYLCVFFMIIIMIGVSGKSLMLLQKRKKEIAVKSAIGTSKDTLRFETCMEVVFLFLISGFGGLIISLMLLFSVRFEVFPVVFSVMAPGIAITSTFLIAMLSSILPVTALNRLSPIMILQKNK